MRSRASSPPACRLSIDPHKKGDSRHYLRKKGTTVVGETRLSPLFAKKGGSPLYSAAITRPDGPQTSADRVYAAPAGTRTPSATTHSVTTAPSPTVTSSHNTDRVTRADGATRTLRPHRGRSLRPSASARSSDVCNRSAGV